MPNLERAVIRDNVTEVTGLDNCSKLTDVVFPDNGSVKSIRGYVHTYDGDLPGAFKNCTGLTCITIPNSVTNIGYLAFDGCTNLMSITIPFVGQCRGRMRGGTRDFGINQLSTDVTRIIRSLTITDETDSGDMAFSGMSALTNITLSANMENIGTDAFMGCRELPSIVIPDSVTNIGERAFAGCRGLKSVKIGAGIKTIHSTAFNACSNIVEVYIPQFISGQAMAIARVFPAAYSSLTNVVISEGATSIGDSAFWGCQRLSAVTIPSTVKSIGSEAFANCTNLVQVTIPDGVETIGDRAFANCTGMKRIFLPLSLYGKIGSSVFEGCGADLEVVYAKVAITATAEHGGHVSGGGSYDVGTLVTLRAVPDSGYAFSCWTGATNSTQNPLTVTADVAKSYTAVFAPLPIAFTSVVSDTNGVALAWNNLAWAGTYRIYRGTTSSLSSATVLVELPNNGNCTYLDKTGVVAREYWYWIKAEGPSDEVMSNPMTGRKEKPIIMSSITYTNLRGATNPNPTTYREGTLVSFQNPGTVTGYTFAGWTPSQITADMTGAQTVRAAWTANSYSIAYNPNGGSGTMNATAATYDSEATVAANGFTCAGHVFMGWATNDVGEVVYAAGQTVSNLTAQSSGVVTLYAVWGIVAAPVVMPADGMVFTEDSCTVTITCATEGAVIYYSPKGATPRLTEAYRYTAPFTITDTATIKAIAVLDGVKSEYVTATLTKRSLSLAEAAGAAELTFMTGGDSDWTPIGDVTAASGVSAQSGAIGDETETWMQTSVSGTGTFSFQWKVDCEWDDSGDATWDHVAVFTNGVEAARIDGASGWVPMAFTFADAGKHTIRWAFSKDDYNEETFSDHAWVSGVTWTPAGGSTDTVVDVGGGKSVTVPGAWIAEHAALVEAAGGDASAALATTAANGRKVWECYALGLDPEDNSATNDFKITSFPLKSDGTPDVEHIVFDPPQARWNVPATYKVKGAVNLNDTVWSEVTEQNKASFRFFKVEVVLP